MCPTCFKEVILGAITRERWENIYNYIYLDYENKEMEIYC